MLAIDTNIIVRLLVDDEPEQAAQAWRLLASETVFVSTTVLLEVEWVLRSAYGLTKPQVLDAIVRFVGLPGVTLEGPTRVSAAIASARSGMDFVDALHLAAAEACEAFLTFDRHLIKAAAALGDTHVKAP